MTKRFTEMAQDAGVRETKLWGTLEGNQCHIFFQVETVELWVNIKHTWNVFEFKSRCYILNHRRSLIWNNSILITNYSFYKLFFLQNNRRLERECKELIEESPISNSAKREALQDLKKATESALLYAKVCFNPQIVHCSLLYKILYKIYITYMCTYIVIKVYSLTV